MHVEPRAPSAGARPQHPRRAVFPAHAGNRHNTVGAARSPLIAQPCTGRSTAIPVFPPLVCTDCRQRINSGRRGDCCRSVPQSTLRLVPRAEMTKDFVTIWRKRVGVEPTTRLAKSRINGFEGHEDHRTPFASGADYSRRSAETRSTACPQPHACSSCWRTPALRPCASRVCASGCATKQDSYRNLHGNLYCRTQVFSPL